MKKLCALLASSLLPLTAHAHPGPHEHDSWFESILHFMSEPDHVAILAAGVVALVVGAVFVGRRRKAPK